MGFFWVLSLNNFLAIVVVSVGLPLFLGVLFGASEGSACGDSSGDSAVTFALSEVSRGTIVVKDALCEIFSS